MEHTPHDCALHLLDVFRSADCEANEYINARMFAYPFSQQDWTLDDYTTGLAYCQEQEWVHVGRNDTICVTSAGLDQIGA